MTASLQECQDLVCSRRRLLALAGAGAGAAALEVAAPTMAFAAGPQSADLLVVVTLSGGADGLSLVPPLHDKGYAAARPGIAVPAKSAIPLDRAFGLHPGLKPLLPYWQRKQLAIVQAVGDSDGTRSHFDATDAMDRGVSLGTSVRSGWVDRLMTERGLSRSAFPALAIGGRSPGTLAGPAPDLSTWDVNGVRVDAPAHRAVAAERALSEMYAGLSGPVAEAGRQTLTSLGSFARVRAHKPAPTGKYPNDVLGGSLRQVAHVAQAGVGLQVACVQGGGWDMHEGMGTGAAGYAHDVISRLGQALAAFAHDLGPRFATTTIVTVSEFGRRVAQNSSGGVDHGHGSAWLVLGGGIRGGRVYGRWPGLSARQLEDGDLRVTTDYRDVLGELALRRLGAASTRRVFPDHRPRELGLARQR
ncbi:MAG TPA: DUF1501 domain-containing protein [Mycobacteriales bacterium]|nr:DUF1501 domain-containing protein [Mycobacteriales bacterium]